MNSCTFAPFFFFTLANVHLVKSLPYPVDFLPVEQFDANLPLSVELQLRVIKDSCIQHGGEASFDHLLAEVTKSKECVAGLANFGESEIEEILSKNRFDVVMHKYCKRLPAVESCLNNLWTAGEQCLDESRKVNLNYTKNMVEAVFDFICLEKGDFFAKFMKEGGPECILEKNQGLDLCVKSAIQKYRHLADLNKRIDWSHIKPSGEECRAVHDLAKCTVNELKRCDTQTAANFFGTLFKMVDDKSPCKSGV